MKRKIISLIMLGVLTISLIGCGKTEDNYDANGNVTLTAQFSTDESDPRVVATQLFKEEVEKASDGRITVNILPKDPELGDEALISNVMDGTIDMTASSAGNFASYANNIGISAFPFLFKDFDEAWAFVDGDMEIKAEAELTDNNIKVIGHYDNGFRCVTTSEEVGPINGVADMDNLTIRTPQNEIVIQTMLTLGANPKPLEFPKLYDALKSGEFGAQENPIPVIYNSKFYEVQSNLAITNHSYDVMPLVIRNDLWESLSEDDQKIVLDAAKVAQQKDRELIKTQTEEYVQKLEAEGMNITYPDLEEFKSASTAVFDTLGKKYDPELLNAVK